MSAICASGAQNFVLHLHRLRVAQTACFCGLRFFGPKGRGLQIRQSALPASFCAGPQGLAIFVSVGEHLNGAPEFVFPREGREGPPLPLSAFSGSRVMLYVPRVRYVVGRKARGT